ncbi:MAG: hypothetical protein WCE21_01730 [Candidatus Babeliales bacterium]
MKRFLCTLLLSVFLLTHSAATVYAMEENGGEEQQINGAAPNAQSDKVPSLYALALQCVAQKVTMPIDLMGRLCTSKPLPIDACGAIGLAKLEHAWTASNGFANQEIIYTELKGALACLVSALENKGSSLEGISKKIVDLIKQKESIQYMLLQGHLDQILEYIPPEQLRFEPIDPTITLATVFPRTPNKKPKLMAPASNLLKKASYIAENQEERTVIKARRHDQTRILTRYTRDKVNNSDAVKTYIIGSSKWEKRILPGKNEWISFEKGMHHGYPEYTVALYPYDNSQSWILIRYATKSAHCSYNETNNKLLFSAKDTRTDAVIAGIWDLTTYTKTHTLVIPDTWSNVRFCWTQQGAVYCSSFFSHLIWDIDQRTENIKLHYFNHYLEKLDAEQDLTKSLHMARRLSTNTLCPELKIAHQALSKIIKERNLEEFINT